jgi:transcriptional regulator with GAF, ATPase, and Fis domain
MAFLDNETNPLPLAPGRRAHDPVIGLRNTDTGAEFAVPLGERRWLLGSRDGADLVLADPYVSGVHCVLERRGQSGPLTVRDRASRNGTFVCGNPIESAELRPGSLLSVGRTTLVAITAASRGQRSTFEQIRGRDPALRLACDHAMRVAQTDCSVLIVGETGTGKDLLARLVHESSRRATGPMVAVNCGGIPGELIGSELFGHERGAFTGAVGERDGYFVEACGGSLFLDELAELPLPLQPHLLRVLETQRVRRVGGAVERTIDVRMIAATNRIDGLGTEGAALRLDLYHRLATVVLRLPPLRERIADLPELLADMMTSHQATFGRKQLEPSVIPTLSAYAWPGNVRELAHAVARAMALGDELLRPEDFLPELGRRERGRGLAGGSPARALLARGTVPPDAAATVAAPAAADAAGRPLPPYEAMLRDAMVDALRRYPSIRGAASFLGMPKSTFADKARAWGLSTRRPAGAARDDDE